MISRPDYALRYAQPSILFVDKEYAGVRLDKFLFQQLPWAAKSLLYRLVRIGAVRINQKATSAQRRLVGNEQVRLPALSIPQEPPRAKMSETKINARSLPQNHHLRRQLRQSILYEDDRLLVINKPEGLAVHGGTHLTHSVIDVLRDEFPIYPQLELAHRLDRETSGILLLAKRRSMLRALHEQLRMHRIQKEYLAIVHGRWKPQKSELAYPLRRGDPHERAMVKVHPQGKPSTTRVKLLMQFEACALLRIRPLTGRTHQIRVHLAEAGHPIVFDARYGHRKLDAKFLNLWPNRLCLHAEKVTLKLPQEPLLHLIAPPTEKLRTILEQLCPKILMPQLHAGIIS